MRYETELISGVTTRELELRLKLAREDGWSTAEKAYSHKGEYYQVIERINNGKDRLERRIRAGTGGI